MPELPEVETARRGIAPHLIDRTVQEVVIRQPRLRWPIPARLGKELPGQRITEVERRAKYLLIRLQQGTLILHLGMSGSLRLLPATTTAQIHDHFDLVLSDGCCLRLRDPRRFGAVLWTRKDPLRHALLRSLGPEPLDSAFNGECLYQWASKRHTAIKNLIMDQRVVVGVGNIYANEALFMAGIHPARSCRRIARKRYLRLTDAIKTVLTAAIEAGGTTLRDFRSADGKPGYFAQELQVYGKEGLACPACGNQLKTLRIGQRASVYCPRCQR